MSRRLPSEKYAPRVSEAQIEEACTQWLMLDGWLRVIKTDLKHLRGLGVQEPGMADRGYVRYGDGGFGHSRKPEAHDQRVNALFLASWVQVFWIEWKRKGGKAGAHQKAWHANERAIGALTLIAGEDFPASIEGFQAWYRASGLMRRSLR